MQFNIILFALAFSATALGKTNNDETEVELPPLNYQRPTTPIPSSDNSYVSLQNLPRTPSNKGIGNYPLYKSDSLGNFDKYPLEDIPLDSDSEDEEEVPVTIPGILSVFKGFGCKSPITQKRINNDRTCVSVGASSLGVTRTLKGFSIANFVGFKNGCGMGPAPKSAPVECGKCNSYKSSVAGKDTSVSYKMDC